MERVDQLVFVGVQVAKYLIQTILEQSQPKKFSFSKTTESSSCSKMTALKAHSRVYEHHTKNFQADAVGHAFLVSNSPLFLVGKFITNQAGPAEKNSDALLDRNPILDDLVASITLLKRAYYGTWNYHVKKPARVLLHLKIGHLE
ncbi:hypothetical protein GcC1_143007 [Golovinomyces cichoracearum]|uniref:Uncharacterized protein n=1 Tax=Golovinomyces cichoracearum TaxID=62708 RepID=A0A420HZP4_9PEZI|nr:hypothetical protein GcC1_143007 [Golovinomyces cichoracearum]